MIAPGIRVVRGPDWIWQNQGELRAHFSALLLLCSARKRDKRRNKFEIKFGSSGHGCRSNRREGKPRPRSVNICSHFEFTSFLSSVGCAENRLGGREAIRQSSEKAIELLSKGEV